MTAERPAESTDRGGAAAFSAFLDELKARGSLLLLVGPAQHTALERACNRLLGEPTERRQHVFVRAGGTGPSPRPQSVPGSATRTARTIHYPTVTRSATAAHAPAGSAAPRVVDGGLGDLLEAIQHAIEEARTASGSLTEAELRICLDSLDSLLAAHDQDHVFQFLHALSGPVRDASAMCHVHLPTPLTAEPVGTLSPLFDAVVEVRDAGRPQQRWHVPAEELRTDWLEL